MLFCFQVSKKGLFSVRRRCLLNPEAAHSLLLPLSIGKSTTRFLPGHTTVGGSPGMTAAAALGLLNT